MSPTPGPWIARNQRSKRGEGLGWIIETDSGRGGRIGWSSRAFADTNQGEAEGGTETEANARLMAAAPDLLEAAHRAVAFLDTIEWNDTTAEVGGGDCQHALELAIAKAEGQ